MTAPHPICGACGAAWTGGDCCADLLPSDATGTQLEQFAALFRLLGANVDPKQAAREAAKMLGFTKGGQ